MKKQVKIDKELSFSTMIGEISAISLEKNLQFIDGNTIEGNFFVYGKYKMTEASRVEEDFSYEIPVNITLLEELDLSTAQVEISDFTYEIVPDSGLLCHIELWIEGEEKVEIMEEENRECDGMVEEKEIEIPSIEVFPPEDKEEKNVDSETEEVVELDTTENDSLFFQWQDEQDTYGTLLVYVIQPNETLTSILEKYSVSREELEEYNDLTQIDAGAKLIIPLKNE